MAADDPFRKRTFRNIPVGGPQRSLCDNRLKELSTGHWARKASWKVRAEKEFLFFVEQAYAQQQINTRKSGLGSL